MFFLYCRFFEEFDDKESFAGSSTLEAPRWCLGNGPYSLLTLTHPSKGLLSRPIRAGLPGQANNLKHKKQQRRRNISLSLLLLLRQLSCAAPPLSSSLLSPPPHSCRTVHVHSSFVRNSPNFHVVLRTIVLRTGTTHIYTDRLPLFLWTKPHKDA